MSPLSNATSFYRNKLIVTTISCESVVTKNLVAQTSLSFQRIRASKQYFRLISYRGKKNKE